MKKLFTLLIVFLLSISVAIPIYAYKYTEDYYYIWQVEELFENIKEVEELAQLYEKNGEFKKLEELLKGLDEIEALAKILIELEELEELINGTGKPINGYFGSPTQPKQSIDDSIYIDKPKYLYKDEKTGLPIGLYTPKNQYDSSVELKTPNLDLKIEEDIYKFNMLIYPTEYKEQFEHKVCYIDGSLYLPVNTILEKNGYWVRETVDGKNLIIYNTENICFISENISLLGRCSVKYYDYLDHNIYNGLVGANNTILSLHNIEKPIIKMDDEFYAPIESFSYMMFFPTSDDEDFQPQETFNKETKTVDFVTYKTEEEIPNFDTVFETLTAMLDLNLFSLHSKDITSDEKDLMNNYYLRYEFNDAFYNMYYYNENLGNYIKLAEQTIVKNISIGEKVVIDTNKKLKFSFIDETWIAHFTDEEYNFYEMPSTFKYINEKGEVKTFPY